MLYRLYLPSPAAKNYYLADSGKTWEGNLETANKLWEALLVRGTCYLMEEVN